jgi:MFS family permease
VTGSTGGRWFGAGFGVLADARYRRFLAGAISYSIALWSFQTVMVWATLQRTGSAAAVSLLTICITLPTLLFTLVAGTLADRRDPRTVMLIAQSCAVACVGLALLVAAADQISLIASAALIFLVGCFDAFSNVPAMVYVGRLVEPRLMASALGLSGLQVGSGRIGGGIVAGVAFQLGGPVAGLGFCMGALGLSALIVWTLPRLPRADATPAAGRFGLDDVRVALTWVRQSPSSISIIVLGLAAATFVYSYFTLIPIFARDQLGGGSVTLGVLTSSGGVGVLIGALVIDAIGRRLGRGRVVLGSLVLASVAFALLGASRVLPVSMLLMVVMTGSLGVYRVTCQLLLQALAPARIRGRVLATYELTFWGIFTVGTLAAGALADAYGSGAVALAFGAATIGCVMMVLLGYRVFAGLNVDAEGRAVLAGRILSGRTPPVLHGAPEAERTP